MGLMGPATMWQRPAIMFPIPMESFMPPMSGILSIMDDIPPGKMKCWQFMHIFPSSGWVW